MVPLVEPQATYSRWMFLPPALMDMVATSTMYVGLNLTYASSFQMLRGSVIVFTGLLSVAFLHRVLENIKWIGIWFVLLGLGVVGASDLLFMSGDSHGRNNIITGNPLLSILGSEQAKTNCLTLFKRIGDLLIIMAQIITSCQMVYEEKFINKHNVPALKAVGWEGVFGFCTLGLLLFPMYYIPVPRPFGGKQKNLMRSKRKCEHIYLQAHPVLSWKMLLMDLFNWGTILG